MLEDSLQTPPISAEPEALRWQLADVQAALAAGRDQNRFLAALGHELRNPLAPIRNSVALLKRAASNDPIIQRAQEIIDRQVLQLTRLVDDLLDVSRLGQGSISLCRTELDLAGVAAEVVAEHLPLLEASGVGLEFKASSGPFRAQGDAVRIGQIIDHLLRNANKFTDRGGRVTVELRRDPDGFALLSVRDSGIGMDPGTQARLFEPFAQDPSPAAHARGGLGLGLALVKGLAALHGGTVSAHSDGPGLGSEFTLRLPLLQPGAPARPGAPAVQNPRNPHPRRILIVEDLLDAAITMELLLEMLGHTVEIAADGKTGLGKAESFAPEIILCDIGLPGQMDGYEMARAIRAVPRTRSAYLIALTGFGTPEDKARAVEAGFDLHLTKPVDPAFLEPLIAAIPVCS